MPDDAAPPMPPTVPPDDPARHLTVARPNDDDSLPHFGLVGDTYTVLVAGSDTNGKYTLIDMHVPPGGGPPPHRHDFEEMFTVLDGEVEVTFRGERLTREAGETINVPANAPHGFHNAATGPSRTAVPVCSGWPRRVFRPRRAAGGDPYGTPRTARSCCPRRLYRQSAIPGAALRH